MTKLVAPFLLSGVMQSLRTVPLDDAVMLDAVKRSALPKLEELTSVDDEDPEVLAYLEKNPRIISLEWSNLNVAGSIKRWPASVRARLQRLTAADPITKAKVIWPLLPKLKALSLGFSLPITMRRGDEKNAWVAAQGVIYSDLKGLPKTVKTVELTGNAALAKRFEKAYPRLTIVSKPTPSGLITNPKG